MIKKFVLNEQLKSFAIAITNVNTSFFDNYHTDRSINSFCTCQKPSRFQRSTAYILQMANIFRTSQIAIVVKLAMQHYYRVRRLTSTQVHTSNNFNNKLPTEREVKLRLGVISASEMSIQINRNEFYRTVTLQQL